MFYKIIFSWLIIAFWGISVIAENRANSDPKEILKTALENKKRLTYKLSAIKEYPELSLTAEELLYNKANPDGSNDIRFDEQAKTGGVAGGDHFTMIKNSEGEFHIQLGNIYKLSYEEKARGYAEKDLPTKGETVKLQMEEVSLRGFRCYKIIKTVKPDAAAFENFKNYFPVWYQKNNQNRLVSDFKKDFPTTQIYYIDKKTMLPFKYEFYNADAQLVYSHEYQTIEIKKEIDDSLFESPRNGKVLVMDSSGKYMAESSQAAVHVIQKSKKHTSNKTISYYWEKTMSYLDNHFSTICSSFSSILFWLSIALFAVAGVYKLRMRKK